MLDTPENPGSEENKESFRGLIKEIAADQLIALGYENVLADARKWLDGEVGYPEVLLTKLNRIPNQDEARKLLSAALFGIPFSWDEENIVIASYKLEEPSNRTIQTEIDPNRDSKALIKSVPNKEGTKLLVGKVAGTGFLPKGEASLTAIRGVIWGEKKFVGTHIDDPLVKMTIEPSGTAYCVQIIRKL